jgi:hypothetical protein
VITLYRKNRPWSGLPRADYVRVVSKSPELIEGFRIDGGRLAREPVGAGYLKQYGAWYHPATSWEIEEYRRMGGIA